MTIKKARVLGDHFVRFYLSNGNHVDRDFSLVRGQVFDKIWNNPRQFKKLRVVGGVPTWPGEVDFCPDAVLKGGLRGRIPGEAIIGPLGTLLSSKGVTRL